MFMRLYRGARFVRVYKEYRARIVKKSLKKIVKITEKSVDNARGVVVLYIRSPTGARTFVHKCSYSETA